MNLHIVAGRIAKFEMKYTPNGSAVMNFSIPTESYLGKAKGKVTQWHNCVLIGKRAESLSKYMDKGSQVTVKGESRKRSYENKKGETVHITELFVEDVTLQNSKGSSDQNNAFDNEPQYQVKPDESFAQDDMPF